MHLRPSLRRTCVALTLTAVAGASVAATAGTAVAATTAAGTRPVITGLSPSDGCHRGGTTVVITGARFTGATQIEFGRARTTDFTVDSDTSITVVTPKKAGLGRRGDTVQVRVDTPAGQNGPSAASTYQYDPIFGPCS